MKVNKCKNCIYYDRHIRTCDYLLLTGRRRGCEIGKNCTRFEDRDGRDRRIGVLTINENQGYNKLVSPKNAKRLALYEKGLTDREIADAEGCNPDAIRIWRQRNGLVAQRYREEAN